MKTIDFRIQVQKTSYTCGAASMKWINYHHTNHTVSEMSLYRIGKAAQLELTGDLDRTGRGSENNSLNAVDQKSGLGSTGIIEIAHTLDLKGMISQTGDLNKLEFFIKQNIPVLIDFQCPRQNPGNAGHYSVVIGVKGDKVVIADPGNANFLRYDMKYSDLQKIWWDPTPKHNNWMAAFWKKEDRVNVPFNGRYI
jgi:predicted double-glycine peptidase